MPNTTNITCPKCGALVPLTEAVSHSVREELSAEFQRRLDSAKEQLFAEASRQARVQVSLELTDLRNQVAEQQVKLGRAQSAELELRKQQRQLEASRQHFELELTRRLDAERRQIADAARQQTLEAERLKQADKDLLIKGLQDQITALKQRAEQGSVQAQGEALELTLEGDLRQQFPFDEVVEVKKGERGADVLQRVRTHAALDCGSILWEAKRARNWSQPWVLKLKEDQRAARAELAVLVVTCLPDGAHGIAHVDGIWLCEPSFACVLAAALRQGLVAAAVQRAQENGRADKKTHLYDYVCGVEFRQHIEAVVESFVALQHQLAAEKRAFDRQWEEREKRLRNALRHTAMLYGSIQGIAGRTALPQIQTLELVDSDSARSAHPNPATTSARAEDDPPAR